MNYIFLPDMKLDYVKSFDAYYNLIKRITIGSLIECYLNSIFTLKTNTHIINATYKWISIHTLIDC